MDSVYHKWERYWIFLTKYYTATSVKVVFCSMFSSKSSLVKIVKLYDSKEISAINPFIIASATLA